MSESGESINGFLQRIAPSAIAYTRINRVEVCGTVIKRGDRFVLDLYRGEGYVCRMPDLDGPTFHTHTEFSTPYFSDADFGKPGYLAFGNVLKYQSGDIASVKTISSRLGQRRTQLWPDQPKS